jgi:dipeptidyl aminopeptidase/acylaminoacyl peptidase
VSGNGNGNGSQVVDSLSDTLSAEDSIRFEIKVPTNAELAANLKGKLLLVHGDMDNNVHPGNTIRLVNALIKANKRFDMMILPGKAHGFADMQPYFTKMMFEYFTEHLLGDYYRAGAEID